MEKAYTDQRTCLNVDGDLNIDTRREEDRNVQYEGF